MAKKDMGRVEAPQLSKQRTTRIKNTKPVSDQEKGHAEKIALQLQNPRTNQAKQGAANQEILRAKGNKECAPRLFLPCFFTGILWVVLLLMLRSKWVVVLAAAAVVQLWELGRAWVAILSIFLVSFSTERVSCMSWGGVCVCLSLDCFWLRILLLFYDFMIFF